MAKVSTVFGLNVVKESSTHKESTPTVPSKVEQFFSWLSSVFTSSSTPQPIPPAPPAPPSPLSPEDAKDFAKRAKDAQQRAQKWLATTYQTATFVSWFAFGRNRDMEEKITGVMQKLKDALQRAAVLFEIKLEPQVKTINQVADVFPIDPSDAQLKAFDALINHSSETMVDFSDVVRECDVLLGEIDKTLQFYERHLDFSSSAATVGKCMTASGAFLVPGLIVWGVSAAFELRYDSCIKTWEDYKYRVCEMRKDAISIDSATKDFKQKVQMQQVKYGEYLVTKRAYVEKVTKPNQA